MKHLLILFTGLFIMAAAAGCSDSDAETGDMNEMSAEELQAEVEEGMEEDKFYVDVREEEEFAESHIQGFENIPMNEVMEDASMLPEDQEIVILCNTQNRSIQVGESMIEQGFDADNLTIVMGGISSYEGEKVE
ncbi:rhodanese-like domain-containing protein [Salipaludibacillus aurantiacus]|uniref:Rhodanese-related sulfurtransferase n=1 Tax=Salipaludibacillus aurantiacus TaxID=1601833 RepID=A0A1H9X247_9BACI|nr:rhodanese-like domain-containing protein [Salipaludibacillus aurantiacus]SES40262.1 Rhodanese-related sulfurtransferase [Salipaludibacillus aurantiacus]